MEIMSLPGQITTNVTSESGSRSQAPTILSRSQAETILSQDIYPIDHSPPLPEIEGNKGKLIQEAFDIVGSKVIVGYSRGFVRVNFFETCEYEAVNDQIYPFIKFMFTNDLVLMQRTLKVDAQLTEHLVQFYTINSGWSYKNNLIVHKDTYKNCESVNPFIYYDIFKTYKIPEVEYNVYVDELGRYISITNTEIELAIKGSISEEYSILSGFCTSIVFKIMNKIQNDENIKDTTYGCIVDRLGKSFLGSLKECGLIAICADLICRCFINLFSKKFGESFKSVETLWKDIIKPKKENFIQTKEFLGNFIERCRLHTEYLLDLKTGHECVFYHDIICMFDLIYSIPTIYTLNDTINEVLERNAIIEHLLPKQKDEITKYRKSLILNFCLGNNDMFNEEITIHMKDLIGTLGWSFFQEVEIFPPVIRKELDIIALTYKPLYNPTQNINTTLEENPVYQFMSLIIAFLTRKKELRDILIRLDTTTIEDLDAIETACLNWEPHLIDNQYKKFHKKFVEKKWYHNLGIRPNPKNQDLLQVNKFIEEANKLLSPKIYPQIILDYPYPNKVAKVDEILKQTINGINSDITKRLELVLEAERLYGKPLTVNHINSNVKTFYENYLGKGSGGSPSPDLLYILGRSRKIVKKGRSQYVTYKKELIKLSDARKIEKQLAKVKNKKQFKQNV
jgi:hypothetical protein